MKPYTITKRSEFPLCVRKFKLLKGICVGGCVGGNKGIYVMGGGLAHSHCHNNDKKNYIDDKYEGWICLRWKHQLKVPIVLFHELAHIITDNEGYYKLFHGKRWKEVVIELGGTLEPIKAYGKEYRGFRKGDR